jgi:hypothetical protein
MLTIQHKMYGEGKVISKEMKGNDIIITAQFSDGKKCRFAAESFKIGAVTASGVLKAEIDAVITAKQAAEEARRNAVKVVPVVTTSAVPYRRHGRTPARKVSVKGSIQEQYETYLEAAGYSVFTKKGYASTVPQYSRAIEKVAQKENLTWAELKKNVEYIIPKYDIGGRFEDFGNRSKKTVINALKRFGEFALTA